ncbi:MAG: nuclear transport factor 2 family protein [Gammaproteobacteria bacterium]
MFSLIDACEWPQLEQHFHSDIEYRRPGYPPINGIDDLLDFYKNRRIIKSGQHVVETVCEADSGRAVSAMGSFVGTDRQGKDLRVRFCDVYHLEDGKIRRRETFFDAPAV